MASETLPQNSFKLQQNAVKTASQTKDVKQWRTVQRYAPTWLVKLVAVDKTDELHEPRLVHPQPLPDGDGNYTTWVISQWVSNWNRTCTFALNSCAKHSLTI